MKAYGLARIGRDAEIRHTASGEVVASLSLAFSYGKKGADGKRAVTWVEGNLWGKRAEALAPYLLKGSLIVATLEDVRIETFRKGDGTEGVKLAGRVIDVDLAGGNDRAASPAPVPRPAPRPAPAPASGSGFDDMDGDIPF